MFGAPSDRALIRRYYLYRATLSVGFITPIFTLFLLRSLTFTQVGVLSALYSVLSVVGEIPTGYVGDRLGRRASLLLSVAFTVGSLAGFVVSEGFLPYAVLYVLWALALTFRSGSMDAWLYDILDERLNTERFSHVRGRGDAVQNWTAAISMVAGGLLYGIEPTYPFIGAVVFNSLGFFPLLSLPKNRQYDGRSEDEPDRIDPREASRVIRDQLMRPPLRSLVLYCGLFSAIVGVGHTYVQPMAIETLTTYATSVDVQLPADTTSATATARSGEAGAAVALGLGLLYAVLTAVSSVGGYYAGAVEDRFGVRRTVLLVPTVTAVILVVPTQLAVLALPMFAVMRTSVPLVQPIANGYINDHVEEVGRATLLSAVSMFYMTLRTPLALGAGLVADASTATTAIAMLGGVFLVIGGVVWLLGEVAPESRATIGEQSGPPVS